jgi:hypothetical protein
MALPSPLSPGPPSNASEVLKMFHILRKQFPGARVVASTFDDYVDALEAAAPDLNLPVVTGNKPTHP